MGVLGATLRFFSPSLALSLCMKTSFPTGSVVLLVPNKLKIEIRVCVCVLIDCEGDKERIWVTGAEYNSVSLLGLGALAYSACQ